MIELGNIDITEAIESKLDRSKWKTYKFSDLVENIVEKVVPIGSGLKHYIGLEHLDSGSLKIRRFGDTDSLIGDKLKIYKGDLIFAKRNSYLKRVAIAEFDAVASAHSMVLRPKPKNVDPKFLPFFMMSEVFWKRAIEISVGSLSPTINWKTLAKQEFLLPPKEEQGKLADLLWAMDDVIEKEKVVLEEIKINDIARLKHLFYDDKSSTRIKLKNIVNIKKGKKPSVLNENGDGLPYCTAQYLRTGVVEQSVPESSWKSAIEIYETDILILWDGSNAGEMLFGKKGFLASTMCKLNITDKSYLKEFVFHFFKI